MTRLPLVLALLPLPALAQNAEEAGLAIREVARLVDTGDLDAREVPSARVSAKGCTVTIATHSVAPDLGQPLTITMTAEADKLAYDSWVPEQKDGRVTVLIPASEAARMTFDFESTEAAAREAFTQRLPAALCTTEGCSAEMDAPGLGFALFGQDMAAAEPVRAALRRYAEHCSEAGSYPIATVPAIPDPAFDTLSAALTVGTPGEVGSSTLSRGEACRIRYAVTDDWGGLTVSGTVEIDVSGLDPDSAKTEGGEALNIRYDGAEGFYSATITADVAQADLFEDRVGQSCSAEACSASISTDRLYLTLVGDDTQERAVRTIAAMKAFHARCTE